MTNPLDNLRYYESLIPIIYEGLFPDNFSLTPDGWALTENIVNRPPVNVIFNGKIQAVRPIGTMDIELLDNQIVEAAQEGQINLVKNYPCGLNCPGCFSENAVFGDSGRLMKWQEIFDVIDDARKIGLTSIKFLGPGEIFNNKDLFDILDACEERNLKFSVFTKGAELGDDKLARKHYGHLGISDAKTLVNKLKNYKTLRILLGFNSFDADKQDKMVGSFKKATNYEIDGLTFKNRGVENYTTKRDKALKYLVDAGFNSPEQGQRLSLIATPLRMDQIDEIAEMYVWAARRNIPLITAPTMESGPKSLGLARHNTKIDSDHHKLVQMYTSIYKRALDEGIITRDKIQQEDISPYPGTAPCNQVANGLFLRLNGQVQMCPGKSSTDAVYGNTHDTPIAQIWAESWNYKQGPKMNNWCTAKTSGMPPAVINMIKEQLDL